MKEVGIRELKNRLSEYIRQVREGEVIMVTDRGEVVAELRAPEAASELEQKYPSWRKWPGRGWSGCPQSLIGRACIHGSLQCRLPARLNACSTRSGRTVDESLRGFQRCSRLAVRGGCRGFGRASVRSGGRGRRVGPHPRRV